MYTFKPPVWVARIIGEGHTFSTGAYTAWKPVKSDTRGSVTVSYPQSYIVHTRVLYLYTFIRTLTDINGSVIVSGSLYLFYFFSLLLNNNNNIIVVVVVLPPRPCVLYVE